MGDGAFYAVASGRVNAGLAGTCASVTIRRRAVSALPGRLDRDLGGHGPVRPAGDPPRARAPARRVVPEAGAGVGAADPRGFGGFGRRPPRRAAPGPRAVRCRARTRRPLTPPPAS